MWTRRSITLKERIGTNTRTAHHATLAWNVSSRKAARVGKGTRISLCGKESRKKQQSYNIAKESILLFHTSLTADALNWKRGSYVKRKIVRNVEGKAKGYGLGEAIAIIGEET